MSNIEYSFYYSGPLLFRTQITNEEIKKIEKLIQKNTFQKKKILQHVKCMFLILVIYKKFYNLI